MANIRDYYSYDYSFNESYQFDSLLKQCGAELESTPSKQETNEKQIDAFLFETNSEQKDLDLHLCNCLNH